MKKVISFLVALTIIVSFAITTSAATITMDNDALSGSGVSNPWSSTGDEEGSYNFPTYLQSSNHYNGDARRGISNAVSNISKNAQYVWFYNYDVGTLSSMTLNTYLNSTSFTDPQAQYIGEVLGGGENNKYKSYETFGYVNQRTAAPGWNYVGQLDCRGNNRIKIYVDSSGTAGTYIGADAVRVNYQ